MRRRQFLITAAAGLMCLCSRTYAQQQRVPVVGLLVTHPPLTDPMFDVVRAGMRHFGYEDGVNIRIEVRTALGHLERVPELAKELVELKPVAILVVNEIAIRALKEATSTIPIVMVGWTVNDPVATGLIDAYARPGGNVTGIYTMDSVLIAKRLEVLKESFPQVSRVAVLWDSSFGRHQVDELQRDPWRQSLVPGGYSRSSHRNRRQARPSTGAGPTSVRVAPTRDENRNAALGGDHPRDRRVPLTGGKISTADCRSGAGFHERNAIAGGSRH